MRFFPQERAAEFPKAETRRYPSTLFINKCRRQVSWIASLGRYPVLNISSLPQRQSR